MVDEMQEQVEQLRGQPDRFGPPEEAITGAVEQEGTEARGQYGHGQMIVRRTVGGGTAGGK